MSLFGRSSAVEKEPFTPTVDVVELARDVAAGLHEVAEALTAINRTAGDPFVRAPMLALRRLCAKLHNQTEPPPTSPPPPPPPGPSRPRDPSSDAPGPWDIEPFAAVDIDQPRIQLKAGEPFPPEWRDTYVLCNLFGPAKAEPWPPSWVTLMRVRRWGVPIEPVPWKPPRSE